MGSIASTDLAVALPFFWADLCLHGSGCERLQEVPLKNSDRTISVIQVGCVSCDGHNNLKMFTILGIKVHYVQNNERNEGCLCWRLLPIY